MRLASCHIGQTSEGTDKVLNKGRFKHYDSIMNTAYLYTYV